MTQPEYIKTFQTINYNRFRESYSLPCDTSFILPKEACTSDLFMIMKAKIHKHCRNKFNNLKTQRLEARQEPEMQGEIDIEPLENEADASDIETFTRTTRSNASTSTTYDDGDPDELCFCCDKKEPYKLRTALTFRLNKKVRECADLLQDFNTISKICSRRNVPPSLFSEILQEGP